MRKRIAVIGDGGWGTALAVLLEGNGHDVRVWGPFAEDIESIRRTRRNTGYLPGVRLPSTITWTADRDEAVQDADVAVLAVPTRFFRRVVTSFAGRPPPSCRYVSVAKGLDQKTHDRMSRLAENILQQGPVAALSGPSHAEEVARGTPTAVTLACTDSVTRKGLQAVFATPRFRVYTSADVTGVELGGALKNVIAIAVGVSDGIGFGDNSRAALITRGLAEMTRLGSALGANPETFAGLSGMGDLIVTCTSRLSRNRAVGERLGKGESIKDILDSMQQVAEGVWNCKSARALAREHGVEMPITEQVYRIVTLHKSPEKTVAELLSRGFGDE